MDPGVLDGIINRLVGARPGKEVELSEEEIGQLCVASRNIFLSQPNLLELEAPIKICGKASFFPSDICLGPVVLLASCFGPFLGRRNHGGEMCTSRLFTSCYSLSRCPNL